MTDSNQNEMLVLQLEVKQSTFPLSTVQRKIFKALIFRGMVSKSISLHNVCGMTA